MNSVPRRARGDRVPLKNDGVSLKDDREALKERSRGSASIIPLLVSLSVSLSNAKGDLKFGRNLSKNSNLPWEFAT